MPDSRSRTLAHTADPTAATDESPRREPMLPEIGLPDPQEPAQAGQPDTEPARPAERPPQAPGVHDPLAPLKALSEAELIALFS